MLGNSASTALVESDHDDPTLYFSHLNQYASQLKSANKGILFLGETFVFGLFGSKDMVNVKDLEEKLKETNPNGVVTKVVDKFTVKEKGKKKGVPLQDVIQISIPGIKIDKEAITQYFSDNGFAIHQ